MKVAIIIVCAVLLGAGMWLADDSIAPLFLNSRIERLGERNLPKLTIERGSTVYCRMKADDFRFPLPPGTWATNGVVLGGFDTADGTVDARFEGSNQMTPFEYQNWLAGKVQIGGQVTALAIPGGLLIQFHYFGDK